MMLPEFGEPLSDRELDVLRAVGQGASNQEIAQQLFISLNTVKVHLRRIYAKLGVSSRTEAVRVGIEQGLVQIGEDRGDRIESREDKLEGEQVEGAVSQTPTVEDQGQPSLYELSSTVDQLPTVPEQQRPNRLPWRWILSVFGGIAGIFLILILFRPIIFNNTVSATPMPTVQLGDSRWFMSQKVPQPTQAMAAVSLGLNFYQIGGQTDAGTTNAVWTYDSQTFQWRQLSSKPTAVAGTTAAVLGGEIIVPGGLLSSGQPTHIVEAYSPTNNAWRTLANLPIPLSGALALSDGSFLYLFGGWDGTAYRAESFWYDPASDQWQPLPPMSQARGFATGNLVRGLIYVLGGFNGQEVLPLCDTFDPASQLWATCPPLLHARQNAGTAVLVNKLYLFGGGDPSSSTYGEQFDPKTNQWREIAMPVMPAEASWHSFGVTQIESQIFLFGGQQNNQYPNQMYIYAPLDNKIYLPAATGG